MKATWKRTRRLRSPASRTTAAPRLGRPSQPGLRQQNGVLADACGRVVRQGCAEVVSLERAQALERIRAWQTPQRALTLAEELASSGHGGQVLALVEQPVGRLAMPAVGVLQQSDQARKCWPDSSRGVGRWRNPGGASR